MAGQNQQGVNPFQQNVLARALVIERSVERIQNIFAQSFNTGQQRDVVINPRNVGLIKGFFVDVEVEVNNTTTGAIVLTPNGPANILSQIRFDDLQNNTRIQTTGWHMHFINTVRNQRPYGLCETLDSSPIGYGNNWDVISGATINGESSGTVKIRYYVPLAYSNDDLRGAIYANVVNATMQLQLTVNPNFYAQSTLDSGASAVYTGTKLASAVTTGVAKVTVYQHYLDQLPMGNQGPILPLQDISTIYELKNTTMTGLSPNQDFTIPYANFRTFLSTTMIYDDGINYEDVDNINYLALRSANFTDIFKYTTEESALLSRLQIGLDFPVPTYFFNHRSRPINTIQYGNMELVINAATVSAGNRVLVGYEDFATINVVSGAGSLPSGG